MMLSNSLTALADDIAARTRELNITALAAAQQSIDIGIKLIDAKEACGHGSWLAFLDRAGTHERHAQRLMSLARAGLKATLVSDLGGVTGALAFAGRRSTPEPEEVLLVCRDDKSPFALVHHSRDHAGHLFIDGADDEQEFAMRRPCADRWLRLPSGIFVNPVWDMVERIVGDTYAVCSFQVCERSVLADFIDGFDSWRAQA